MTDVINASTLTISTAYRQMRLIRQFEEAVLDLSRDGQVAGSVHLCLGQEAIPVGALAALQPSDRVLATYRGHGWALACGSDPVGLLAEIAQRAAGLNGGRAGSPLLSDPEHGFLGENSIVGAGAPIATGVAMAAVAQSTGRVVVASIGDGAMNQGATTEAMVFAAARDLPVVFICENNRWSEMTPTTSMVRNTHLAERAAGIGIHAVTVDGDDPLAVAEAVGEAARRCRGGDGPVFIEAETHRLSGHYNRDIEHYRPDEDKAQAREADPLIRLSRAHPALADEFAAIDREIAQLIDAVKDQVSALPAPDPSDVHEHLYAAVSESAPPTAEVSPAKEMPYFRAVNEALAEALEHRPEVVVYGEDVGVAGGIFGVTRGLRKRFGPDRVFDTPIAEAAILGSAVGSAIEGMRPIIEIMWADFVFVALDQIVNQAANVRYVNRSRLNAPLTIRMQQGVTPGSCAQHSQSVESVLAHIPGIKVGLPATPQDAYDMLRAAIHDPDPTVVIEHRSMYQDKGLVSLGGPIPPAQGARLVRQGADAAIVTWGSSVARSVAAAEALAHSGIEVAILDLRWLRPLDEAAIDRVVAASGGRIVVAHEDVRVGGFGAEVAAGILERTADGAALRIRRVGLPEVRVPSAPVLQDAVLPNAERIAEAVRSLLREV